MRRMDSDVGRDGGGEVNGMYSRVDAAVSGGGEGAGSGERGGEGVFWDGEDILLTGEGRKTGDRANGGDYGGRGKRRRDEGGGRWGVGAGALEDGAMEICIVGACG